MVHDVCLMYDLKQYLMLEKLAAVDLIPTTWECLLEF